jgi:hypothetical protein
MPGLDFLSFNRTQSRVVIGLLTGHTTQRRHLHLMGLSHSPLCRRCAAEDKTLAHILCECEALASLRRAYLGSFLFDSEDINSISLGAIWIFSKETGLPWIYMGHKGPANKGLGACGPSGLQPICKSINQSINRSIGHSQGPLPEIHSNHRRQTFMPKEGIEPAIPAGGRQGYPLRRIPHWRTIQS